MSSMYEHPTLQMSVTPAQRDRAEAWLKEAYADGRLEPEEFDTRMGQVLSAANRRDLNEAFYGLVHVPATSRALGVHAAYQPLVRPGTAQQAGRGVAGLAHLSALPTFVVGPALFFALSPQGSYARREAAKAFNFQLIWLILFFGVGMVRAFTDLDALNPLFPIMLIGWVVLTIVGGAKALQGEDWRNPVKKVVKLEVLSER